MQFDKKIKPFQGFAGFGVSNYRDLFRCHTFYFVYISTDGTDPISIQGIIDPALFVPVHRRAGEPDLGRKRFDTGKAGVR